MSVKRYANWCQSTRRYHGMTETDDGLFVGFNDYDAALATAAHWREQAEQMPILAELRNELETVRFAGEVTGERLGNLVDELRARLAEAERLLISHETYYMSDTLGAWAGQVALYFHGRNAVGSPIRESDDARP